MSHEINPSPDPESLKNFVHMLRIQNILNDDVKDEDVVRAFQKARFLHYGDDSSSPRGRNTIWATDHLDVETDSRGRVVAVWFRCMPLPFKQTRVNKQRADEMRSMYRTNRAMKLKAVEVEIEETNEQV